DVSIDTSPGRTPEETIAKARQIRAAALAPADPSTQDRRVAAAASQMEMQALQQQAEQAREQRSGEGRAAGALAAYRQVAAVGEPATGFSAAA
ncbi:MAG TPA: putative metalloprotease CJM1_0395 family protein, partial [Azonexus sp.]